MKEKKENLIGRIVEGIHDMCYICMKEMSSLMKDEGVLIFFIVVPLVYPLLYGWIYNNEVLRDVPVAVVDKSHSALSRDFIRRYDASSATRVACHCADIEEAKQLMGKDKVFGIMYFPSDFSDRLSRGEQATVSLFCDMSMVFHYKNIYLTATELSLEFGDRFKIVGHKLYTKEDEKITEQPLDYEDVPIFNSAEGYGSFLLPAVLMLILHQTLLLGIGMSAGTARENNRYRDLVPISSHYNGIFRIVLGKSFCYFMIYEVMAAYVLLVVPSIFRVPRLLTLSEYIGLTTPYLLATIFFGMVVSCAVRYRENIMLIIVFMSVPLLFLSGVSWPQSNISPMWQGVSWLFPSTFGVRGFVRLNSMGATIGDIRTEYVALWVQTVVYFLVACVVYRYQIIRARNNAKESLLKMKDSATLAKVKKIVVEDVE